MFRSQNITWQINALILTGLLFCSGVGCIFICTENAKAEEQSTHNYALDSIEEGNSNLLQPHHQWECRLETPRFFAQERKVISSPEFQLAFSFRIYFCTPISVLALDLGTAEVNSPIQKRSLFLLHKVLRI